MAEIATDIQPGVVDEHVQPRVRRRHGAKHGRHILAARHVRHERRRTAPLDAQFLRDGFGRRAVDICHENDGAFTGKPARDASADAVAGPGHKRNQTFQTLHMPANSMNADTHKVSTAAGQGAAQNLAKPPAIPPLPPAAPTFRAW